MKKIISALPIIALLAVTSFSFQASTPATAELEYRKGEVVVELKPGASIAALNERYDTTTIQRIYGTNFYRLRTRGAKGEEKWRKRIAKDADVLSASLNTVMTNPSLYARATVSFPDGYAKPEYTLGGFQSQRGLFSLLKLEYLLDRSRGAGVVVAVIDTGIDRAHPMLAGNLWGDDRPNRDAASDHIDNDGDGLIDDANGWDFVDNDNDPSEAPIDWQPTVTGHGTFIAGLLKTFAPECRIMPIRAFPADGVSDGFTVAAAVKYAADHGAKVINLSLGSKKKLDLLEEAILDARRRGITVVTAVGNEDTNRKIRFPSSMEDVIAVAAVDFSGWKARFSNYGAHIDVCAPGVNLVSTYPSQGTNGYAQWSGTSFAAAIVSAEAALILAVDPRCPDVKKVIEETATDINVLNRNFSGTLGKGLIDPLRALQSLNAENIRQPFDTSTQIVLSPGPAAKGAYGKATVNVSGSTQEFILEAYDMVEHLMCKFVVDGQVVDFRYRTSGLGSMKFYYTNGLYSFSLPESLNPVTKIKRVELRDGDQIVLQGDFDTGGTQTGERVFAKEARFVSTGPGGLVSIQVESSDGTVKRESLVISAEGLISDAVYTVVADGVTVATVTARSDFIKVNMTSDDSLPPELRPVTNIKHIEVRDHMGQVVLQADLPM